MWRALLLSIVVALSAALLACGSDSGDDNSACRISQTTEFPTGPVPTVSLQEAERSVDYNIKQPAALADGVVLKEVLLQDAWLCRKAAKVELVYEGRGTRFTLMEWDGGLNFGPQGNPVDVNGVRGEKSSHQSPGGTVLSVSWRRDGLSFIATDIYAEQLTEARFLEVLNSIP